MKVRNNSSIKIIRYLGISLTKEAQDQYIKDFKTILKEIKET